MGHIMKLNTMHIAMLGLALSAGSFIQADTPATAVTSGADAEIDTRLNAGINATIQNEAVDTRLNFVIESVLSKIDTMTKPGTMFLVR